MVREALRPVGRKPILCRENRGGPQVGGCRPQALEPYLLARGWRVEARTDTLPSGFPWMASEVIAARPPQAETSQL